MPSGVYIRPPAVHQPTYQVWANMIQRCTNSKNPVYRYYGARGITVCERWRKFSNFLADMGEVPKGMWLDRENNDGNYEPDNCRWITPKSSSRNRRNLKLSYEKAQEIRVLYATTNITRAVLAQIYGVNSRTIDRVVAGHIWK